MRRYATLAAPDDPEVWSDVSNMVPTVRGTYKTAPRSTNASITATSAGGVSYAFCGATLSGTRSYAVTATKLWEYSGGLAGTATDRTNAVAVGSNPQMAQYGNVTICVMGNSTATVSSTGGNFSALAGAPQGEYIVVCANAVLVLNTNTSADGWAASDVGDYTTWTPAAGVEAATGRLIDTNGPITGAAVMGGQVYAFKQDAIYRGTYVGSPIFWRWEVVVKGIGHDGRADFKNAMCSCGNFIAFLQSSVDGKARVMLYDGASQPVCVNGDLDLDVDTASSGTIKVFMSYDHADRILYVHVVHDGSNVPTASPTKGLFSYNLEAQRWGKSDEYVAGVDGLLFAHVMGEMPAVYSHFATGVRYPVGWSTSTSSVPNALVLRYTKLASAATGACYLQSSFYGRPDRKTTFRRVTPLLRSKTTSTGGTPVVALEFKTFLERHDTTAVDTKSPTESTVRDRFDFLTTDCFGRAKVTFTDVDVEVDDLLVDQVPAGTD